MRVAFFLIFSLLQWVSSESCKRHSSAEPVNVNSINAVSRDGQKPNELCEILKSGCNANRKCVVIAYCAPKLFSRQNMTHVMHYFSSEFKNQLVVNVSLFDNLGVASSYVEGTRNLGNLQNERRGWYVRTSEREFLMFFRDPVNRGKPVILSP